MDQAAFLKEFSKVRNPVTTIAVTSGKGGVGKTAIAIGLSKFLADRGYRVCLVDGDLGLANVDIVLGLSSKKNLYHVASGEADIEEVLVDTGHGFFVLPGGSGIRELLNMDFFMRKRLASEILKLDGKFHYIIADTAAGISDEVMMFCVSCQDVVVVMTPEPTSITDSYALIKTLNKEFSKRDFKVILNMAESPSDNFSFNYLKMPVERFLKYVRLSFLGTIPKNKAFSLMVREQDLSVLEEVKKYFDPIIEKLVDESTFAPLPTGLGRLALGFMRFKGDAFTH